MKVERWPSTGSPFAILENEFNGLNWRIRRKMDLSQGAYNGVDEERLYFFTPFWQMVEEWVDDDLDSAVEYRAQQFWGVRHIDDAVARRLDRDNDGAWTTDAEDNWYYLTDVMFSVRGITDNDGQIHTRVDYTPYGVAMHRYAADVNGDGAINFTDISTFSNNANSLLEPGDAGYDPDTDLNGDGFSDSGGYSAEQDLFVNQRWSPYSTGGGNPTVNAGWIDNPTDPNGPDNSIGYDGYWFDLAGAADATSTGLYMVRHRVLDVGMGRWVERDPIEYQDGMLLYQYAILNPLVFGDPMGLCGKEPTSPKGCSIKEPRPNPTAFDCCHAMKDPCSDGDLGGVVCCGGKLVTCVWDPEPDPLNPVLPMQPYRPGDEIVLECIRDHEMDHLDDVDCTNCPAGEVCRPEWPDQSIADAEECKAYKREKACLFQRVRKCNEIYKGDLDKITKCWERTKNAEDNVDAWIKDLCK